MSRLRLLIVFLIVLGAEMQYSYSQKVGLHNNHLIHHESNDSAYFSDRFYSKPLKSWELGLKVGLFTIEGDIPATVPSPGIGIDITKPIGYVFSLRFEYLYGIGKGLHWRSSTNFNKNTPWTGLGYIPSGQPNAKPVFYNYRTAVHDVSLQAMLILNNIRFHQSRTKNIFFASVGIGGVVYDAKINALNKANQPYSFDSIPQGTYRTKRVTLKALKNLLDNTYETPGQRKQGRHPELFGKPLRPTLSVGLGMKVKINEKLSISIEDRLTFTNDDLLDAQQWQEQPFADAALTPSFDCYNSASVGLSINLASKQMEPAWWKNPLDYPYAEIRNPKIMKLAPPVLPDSDGDGVTDQFDQEQTPQDCPVDERGVSLDTDDDGVPDNKDKQFLTPTYCFPVDANGIGKCPLEEGCCPAFAKGETDFANCQDRLGSLPAIIFQTGRSTLTGEAKQVLSLIGEKMRLSPACRIVVAGVSRSEVASKRLSRERAEQVIAYLVEIEGISQDRLSLNYSVEKKDFNMVLLSVALDFDYETKKVDPLSKDPFPFYIYVPTGTISYILTEIEWKQIFGNSPTTQRNLSSTDIERLRQYKVLTPLPGYKQLFEKPYVGVFLYNAKIRIEFIRPLRKSPAENKAIINFE